MALIVEVLDARSDDVRSWHRLAGEHLALGRAYDNDVVLDDPYVEAHHARIEPDGAGTFVLRDLGSVNGLVGADGVRRPEFPTTAGTTVRVGHTIIRFQDSDVPPAAAIPDRRGQRTGARLPAWLDTPAAQLGISAGALVVILWLSWLGTYQRSATGDLTDLALGLMFALILWAGIWSVAGRVVTHRFRFLGHLAIAFAALAVLAIWGTVSEWFAFVAPDTALAKPLGIAVVLLLIGVLVAGHLALASAMTRRRRWTAAWITCLILLALGTAASLAERKPFSDVPQFAATLKPLPTSLLPTHRLASFSAVERDLQRQVDALARKTP
ncbi:MAG TPA: FHA domain-containing protein [Gemmatimonadales bacterium]|nr:FHA domain-containing protein [Gemmatimonadales bacterium]